MNIAIFSTRDFHHTYYINRINKIFPISNVIYENRKLAVTIDNSSPFQNEQDKFEKNYFFKKTKDQLDSSINVIDVDSINSERTIEFGVLEKFDLIIVFGCGKIDSKVIKAFDYKIINIHRGIARDYRGLDSDLWAIKNNDFNSIGTTIHYIDENLDTGDIVYEEVAKLSKDDKIYKLRAITTDIAIKGTLFFLNSMTKNKIYRINQDNYGAYYSSMSRKDKDEAKLIFQNYINKLFENEI